MKRLSLLMMASLMLAGCQSVGSKVTVFHNLDNGPRTFAFQPIGDQAGSIEYATYARLISEHLAARGWRRAEKRPADVIIGFSYGIDNGKTVVSSYPIFGQTGGGVSQTYGTVNVGGQFGSYSATTFRPATYGVVGSGVSEDTVYTRELRIVMADGRSPSGPNVYEATVKSTGSTDNFATVSKCLIDSVFRDFPGASGSTRNVEISSSECTQK